MVTVQLDIAITIPDALARLVQDESRAVFKLAGFEVVESDLADLDCIRSVDVGESWA